MDKYNYFENVKADILDYISEEYTADQISEKLADRDDWKQELNEELWICDSVTGNASGSYYFSTWKAEEALSHNWELLAEALEEFGCEDVNPIEKGAEWCDVSIRCYLLGSCIAEALDELEQTTGVSIPLF